MIRIEGEVLINFLDEFGQKTRSSVSQCNAVFNRTLLSILNWTPNPVFIKQGDSFNGGANIYISQDDSLIDRDNEVVSDILAIGEVPNGEVSPIWYEDVEPNFGQIINQFLINGF